MSEFEKLQELSPINIYFLLFIVVGSLIWLANKYGRKTWYTFQGRRTKSFVCHGIVLCYEQTELGQMMDTPGRWHVDLNGRGRLETSEYILFSNPHGGTTMQADGKMIFEKEHKDYADKVFIKLQNDYPNLRFNMSQTNDGRSTIRVEGDVEGDPRESDARYYISGYYDNIIVPVIVDVMKDYNAYKLENKSKYHIL